MTGNTQTPDDFHPGENVAFTCPGHSFKVSTIYRGYDIPALGTTLYGFETMAFSLPDDGDAPRILYEYHSRTEAKARRAHYLISKRLSRLYPGVVQRV